jgi:hypothetical protein
MKVLHGLVVVNKYPSRDKASVFGPRFLDSFLVFHAHTAAQPVW